MNESSDELGIYLRCTCTSMADNNLLTMDPTDDSSSSSSLSYSQKQKNSGDDMSTQLILSEGSRLHITMKINTTVSWGVTLFQSLSFSWHSYRYTLVMCFALQYLRESRSQCSQDKIASLRFSVLRSILLLIKVVSCRDECQNSCWTADWENCDRTKSWTASLTTDIPMIFSHLILAKTLLTTQPSRVERVCLWRILFF